MLEHPDGVIGLPLRLLAREVYDKLVKKVGLGDVALVTGEEKRLPRRPRYWVCTTESMPRDLHASFLAVDEIQLCSHLERGHIFTDRLLNWRGKAETWFMGAETIRPVVESLVPEALIEKRPRLSKLSHAGPMSLGELLPRTAIVAFSFPKVYELAERLRAKRGGAAVVLGALSPSARNAQVELYQSGEVDYLVATDAIGMGLNLDVDCVAFAGNLKYDGRRHTVVDTDDLAQIAGRAGRARNDGTFATLNPMPEFEPDIIRAIETHRFSSKRFAIWRNADLDMTSAPALLKSLRVPPPHKMLRLQGEASDQAALLSLSEIKEIKNTLTSQRNVELLWEVCQIPDFRQLYLDEHVRLLKTVYLQLLNHGRLRPDWVSGNLKRLDNGGGETEALLARMASIRTFSYIANHRHWVDENHGFTAEARQIEDRLSDALHNALVDRFVDARRRFGHHPTKKKSVSLTSTTLNSLAALKDAIAAQENPGANREQWAQELVTADDDAFQLEETGVVRDHSRLEIARLRPGSDLHRPQVVITAEVSGGQKKQLQSRISAWLTREIDGLLSPVTILNDLDPPAPVRGIAYQMGQTLGIALTADVAPQLDLLDAHWRDILDRLGIILGQHAVYVENAVSPTGCLLRLALVNGHLAPNQRINLSLKPPKPSEKTNSDSGPNGCSNNRSNSRSAPPAAKGTPTPDTPGRPPRPRRPPGPTKCVRVDQGVSPHLYTASGFPPLRTRTT